MISASTLFLVTLAINVASVFGAPIRIPDASSSVAARAEAPAPAVQPVARAAIVEVGRRSRFSQPRARLAKESDLFDEVVAREPEPETQLEQRADEPIMRRYPRRALHDFYEKREPATTVKETTVVVTKHITHDTPADASAYYSSHHGAGGYQPPTDGYHPPAGGYQPPAGGYYPPAGGYQPPAGGYQYPPPVAGGHVTTLIDITQTITSAASTTTSSTVTATTTETTSTATATTTETTSTASVTATTTTESASIATVTPAPPAAPPAANYPAAAGDVKVDYPAGDPTGDKKDVVPPAAGAPTGDKKDVPPAVDAAGDKKVVPSTADDATPAGFTTPVKRHEQYKPSTVSTLIGRQIGVSGAAMASAVRRGLALDLSIH
jgi:hypothetical protein